MPPIPASGRSHDAPTRARAGARWVIPPAPITQMYVRDPRERRAERGGYAAARKGTEVRDD
jgi:hypothetical protein